MRRFTLDELPQFYNVVRGEMSLAGPRPKLPQYEAIANMPNRPGISGAATLAFRREEEILSNIHPSQLDIFYAKRIKLLKARIDVRYMSHATFRTDMRMIAATFLACAVPAASAAGACQATLQSCEPIDRVYNGACSPAWAHPPGGVFLEGFPDFSASACAFSPLRTVPLERGSGHPKPGAGLRDQG
jgi:hypothetical protein